MFLSMKITGPPSCKTQFKSGATLINQKQFCHETYFLINFLTVEMSQVSTFYKNSKLKMMSLVGLLDVVKCSPVPL